MRRTKFGFAICLFFAFAASLLPSSKTLAEETPIPEGFTAIYDRAGLEAVSSVPDGNYILMSDLPLTDGTFTPLCSEEAPFSGVFDGNGYTIYGLTAAEKDGASGLFACIDGGTVRQLTVSGTAAGTIAGLIAGKLDRGSVQNCTVRGTVQGRYSGGIAGQIRGDNVTVEACDSYANALLAADETETNERSAGGIAGTASGTNVVLRNLRFFGSLSFSGGAALTGGITGSASGDVVIRDCSCEGAITLSDVTSAYAGGVAGILQGTVRTAGCVSSVVLTAAGSGQVTAGGVCGQISGDGSITQSSFSGKVSATASSVQAGGIAGLVWGESGNTELSRCSFSGTVFGQGSACYVGGIAGICRAETGTTTVENCRSAGTVQNPSDPSAEAQIGTGGIVGLNCGYASATVRQCISVCDVQAEFPLCAGTAVGANWSFAEGAAVTVSQCYYPFGGEDYFALALSGDRLSDPNAYTGLDFETVWMQDGVTGIPVLRTETGTQTPVAGDADGDGRVTSADAGLISGYLTGQTTLSSDQQGRSDIDGDGAVTAADVMMILRKSDS